MSYSYVHEHPIFWPSVNTQMTILCGHTQLEPRLENNQVVVFVVVRPAYFEISTAIGDAIPREKKEQASDRG